MSNYSEMSYTELQKAAKEAGIPANQTKDELIAALEATGDAEPAEKTAPEAEPEQPAEEAAPEPATPKANRVSDADVAKAHMTDAQKMKKHLDAQPKVKVMIPFDAGVDGSVAKKIPFIVNLNGYRYEIQRGVFVEVPQQIAEIVMERLESEGKIGEEFRLDRNADKQAALG